MFRYVFTLLFVALLTSSIASAAEKALLIVALENGQTIAQEGNTKAAYAPCSTFKIPLALMGFDQKILLSADEPLWPYQEEYSDSRPEVRTAMNPTSWLANSAIWYSQVLTRTMGKAIFTDYVNRLHYGNQDISGDPGQNNGLTHGWLSSSLQISPEEQVAFLRKMLRHELPVSDKAVAMTQAIMPVFATPNGWKIYGKTGGGFLRKADDRQKNRSLSDSKQMRQTKQTFGWFVGWAVKEDRVLVFAYLLNNGGNGMKARDAFLVEWPDHVK